MGRLGKLLKRAAVFAAGMAILLSRSANVAVYRKGSGEGKKIALPFDDGPSKRNTEEILAILGEYGVKATFFVIGENATLDNNGDMAFFGSVMVSNATDKTVFSGGGRNATAIRSVGGSFAKGGAGVLTLPAKFTGAVASLEIQDGVVDFYVGEGMDYSISGPVEALGHVRKSGPGTLTHAVGGMYSA